MLLNFHHGFLVACGIIAARRRLHPLLGGGIAGGVRAVEFWETKPTAEMLAGVFVAFGGLAALAAWLFLRLDRRDAAEPPRPLYLAGRRGPFRWEYVPLGLAMLGLFALEAILTWVALPPIE